MNELTKNKVKYILLRYKYESKDLKLHLRLELLKRWINSCVDSEEYEMASALQEKRNELIRDIRLSKVGHRHFVDDCYIQLKWNIRKIIRKIKLKFF